MVSCLVTLTDLARLSAIAEFLGFSTTVRRFSLSSFF